MRVTLCSFAVMANYLQVQKLFTCQIQAHPLQTVFNKPLIQRQTVNHLMLLQQDLRFHGHHQHTLTLRLPRNMPWRWRLGVWRYRYASWRRNWGKWTGWRTQGRPVLINCQWWSSWKNSYQPKHTLLWVNRCICHSGRLLVFGRPIRTNLSGLWYMPVRTVTDYCWECFLCHLSAHCRSSINLNHCIYLSFSLLYWIFPFYSA